ncbi:Uu.00g119140.m01.CDS01 [Anthostomella pinea]|uniref:Exosome complex protein n=1 Tax=Anthostomella pinea TaxID=933095 RepID=A0AAI8VGK3_9PEZI|nr:Uu.00g119140.m01.CDS01 [Anthostomella pinea]
MDPGNILPQLERLDDEVDNLEEALQPLLNNVSDVASKLPLLDKAKLYVLVTYSIESMLFSSLRLDGVQAKEHPVFKELIRVRQYFEKIKNIETPPPQKREQTLNKEAAIRFIRSDLSDNKEVNTKLTEMIAKERAKAALKNPQLGEKRKVDETSSSDDSSEDAGSKETTEADVEPEPEKKKVKKDKKEKKEKKDKKQRKGKKSKKSSK